MKKKIQKYLSGEREGFSLVELIIVIAIMAILIGIVALAVLPYLEKSRVSKDKQLIDTVYSACQSTIADYKANGKAVPASFTWASGSNATAGSFEEAVVKLTEYATPGAIVDKLASEGATGIKFTYKDGATVNECEYTVEATGTKVDPSIKSSNK